MCHGQLLLHQMAPNYGQSPTDVLKPGKVGGPRLSQSSQSNVGLLGESQQEIRGGKHKLPGRSQAHNKNPPDTVTGETTACESISFRLSEFILNGFMTMLRLQPSVLQRI